jgi:hypothetical protein
MGCLAQDDEAIGDATLLIATVGNASTVPSQMGCSSATVATIHRASIRRTCSSEPIWTITETCGQKDEDSERLLQAKDITSLGSLFNKFSK